ncbi:Alpha/Beta hydrolase protein [Fomitopsis serialis]|uniref:Alpha/Beta hydrolase protein n=1 Tax=Fomitopsis serialis TaxID=139415 RepID=UPI00200893AC|nr:Alpha/Beta hydrolase protein [Neoantrodia serialis]KAH9928842.1 Alpha/Beta hydrolase protein [Neoantrodia serialis]
MQNIYHKLRQHREQVAEDWVLQSRSDVAGGPGTVQNITFSNPQASEFYVDGSSLPEITWDIGPSWAGLLPISNNTNETRQLFFWYFPPGPQGSLDDLILWINGGPGCSSMQGLLQEVGPISWEIGRAIPHSNEHSWTNLSSILFIDQPVGTGFSQGTPDIENEDQLAEQLVGFLQQFLEVFSELKGNNFYTTGESYAGMYVPYITNYIYENPDALDLNMTGFWISDPVISWNVVQADIPAMDFVHKYQNVFAFNQSYMSQLDAKAAACNYSGYMEQYVTYPPTGLLPLPGGSIYPVEGCDIWETIFSAALKVNPAFNVYRIFDTWPVPFDILGFPGSFFEIQTTPYFARDDAVFAGDGDTSLPSAFTVLPNIIQKSERSVIVQGLADYLLMADGARIAIQNMTWDGLQGFQTSITNDSFVVEGVGALGNAHYERGLAYVEVALSGHMVPEFSPVAAYQIMEYLMGFRANVSAV